MKKKTQKWVRVRHKVYIAILKYPVMFIFWLLYGFKHKKIKLAKNENAFIISNHQTQFDPILVSLGVNKPVYYVATDTLFSNKFVSSLLNHLFAPIPKKKGLTDPKCIKTMMKIAKEKGSIGLFAEGNRSYAEFQYHIDAGLARLIKTLKMPLILFNIHGGTGCFPRFAKGFRRGKFYGSVAKRIDAEEYLKMSDAELIEVIKESIKVYDSDNGYEYKSKHRAENLENMLFVCPTCGKTQTLHSKNEYILCSNCDLKVEYTTKLHLKSDNKDFTYDILNDWYEMQKNWCLNSTFKEDEIIFKDEDVKLFITQVNKPRKLISKGKLILTPTKLIFEEKEFELKDLIIASAIGGRKFNFSMPDADYLVIGHKRFNPLKYVLMFNRLDTHMKEKQTDKYFTLN